MPAEATVESNSNKLPTLTSGTVTPLVANEFFFACTNYFRVKKVEPDVQTAMTFSCFRDQCIVNWLSAPANATRLGDMPFSAFQLEFKRKFLRADWEQCTRAEILVSRMKDTETFSDFSTNVIALNSLLLETEAHLNDTRIRHTLEAGMIEGLQFIYNKDKTANAIDTDHLDDWIEAVNSIDEDRAHSLATAHRIAAEEAQKLAKRKAADDGERAAKKLFGESSRKANTTTAGANGGPSTSTAPFVGKKCPKLTEEERKLLIENDGCTVCRRVFVGHDRTACTNGFPSGENYVPVTADVVAAAAAARNTNKGKAKSIAVVMNPVEDSDDSEDTDPDLSVSSLHRASHFFWDCLIEGPMSNYPLKIRGLMDDGAFLALIDAALADKLELRRFKLHKPEPIALALADSDSSSNAETLLTEYVKIPLHSRDQRWSSSVVRFVVAPNLCAPVILGLPWLIKNKIVMDYDAGTAIDKRTGFDLLNPPPIPPQPQPKLKLREKIRRTQTDRKTMLKELEAVCEKRRLDLESRNLFEPVKPVDIIAAVRERVEILAHWDELQKRGEALKSEYTTLFEPMPHVNDLPTDVLCHIAVKDADFSFKTRTYQSPRKYKEAWQ
ncbi:hypothetical protein B0H11DRAFT_1684757, partial [Mycena galericulata]